MLTAESLLSRLLNRKLTAMLIGDSVDSGIGQHQFIGISD